MGVEWVVFDLGGVLIDWNPRYVYGPGPRTDEFFEKIATSEWNSQMDKGTLFQSAIDRRGDEFPEWRSELQKWRDEWPTMMSGAIAETVSVFKEVVARKKNGGLKGVLALSNWEENTFKIAKARFPFLADFDGKLISGEEKKIKPDPAFFELLESRYGVDPRRAIFIDDLSKNTEVAARLGYDVHVFKNAVELRLDLVRRGVLPIDLVPTR